MSLKKRDWVFFFVILPTKSSFMLRLQNLRNFGKGILTLITLLSALTGEAQSPTRSYVGCNHDSLVVLLRSYEDSLALSTSAAVVRANYAQRVTDLGVTGKEYLIYRCDALHDSLQALMDALVLVRSSAPGSSCGSPVAFDGYNYATVLIGTQCWFAENLRSENYRDGSAIPGNLDNVSWRTASSGAQTIYDQGTANEATNLATYGRLYNGYAVNHPAGLCPSGWHVPTDADWTTLTTQLGGLSVAGGPMKTAAWGGDNSSGFTALPAGHRGFDNGNFYVLGSWSNFWSSTMDGSYAWFRDLNAANSTVSRNSHDLRYGFSVRCVLD